MVCPVGLVLWGIGWHGNSQCLAHLRVIVNTWSNMLWCQESNKKQTAICFCLMTSDSLWGTHLLNLYTLCKAGEAWLSSETWNKLNTSLAVVLLYGHFQGLIIQDLWPINIAFVTKRQNSQPEILQPISGSAFTNINLKDSMYSTTWNGCGQAQIKVIK